MDFMANLVIVGVFLIFLALCLITAVMSIVVGHMIGDKYDQSYLGGLIGLIFWAWIFVSFITSTEFMTWAGLI